MTCPPGEKHDLVSSRMVLSKGYLTVLDEKGEPYTDLNIAQIIYDLADKEMNETKIAKFLNEKHVPTGKEAYWHLSSVAKMLADEYVIGKAPVFVHHIINKPGVKKLIAYLPQFPECQYHISSTQSTSPNKDGSLLSIFRILHYLCLIAYHI